MAQDRDDRPSVSVVKKAGEGTEDNPKKVAGTVGRTAPREAVNGGNGGTASAGSATRRERYLIGIRDGTGVQSMDTIVEYLRRQENVDVVRRIKLGGAQPFAAERGGANEVIVAKIDAGKAERLRAAAPPHLIIEHDALLHRADTLTLPAQAAAIGTMLPLRSVATEIAIRVLGERDQPLGKATVVLYGEGLPAQALTDDSGVARLTFFGGPVESVQALCINPAANHWDRFIVAPRLNASGVNTVTVHPLSELFPGFPNERLLGWGQRLMHIEQTGARFTGSGVRIGIIDSGCDNSHPQLRHVTHGRDFTEGASDSSWTEDVISHGTHCTGVIAAASTGQGVVGFAPEAQVHVLKVLPGGRVSDLLAALDECIEQELDIVNISAVSAEMSELVAQKLQEARQKGIACIAAAGNWGGTVGFPAILPTVMAVAAVGKLKEFPADSCHTHSVIPHLVGADGVFAASFSSTGPQISVSAPGVAVVSTVPGGGYAPSDGTSVAAAHVTGLAALVLAHHPLFQEGPYRMRSEQRVQALLSLIQASAVPHFADSQRGGAGVPDLQRVPGEQTRAIPAWPGMMFVAPNSWQVLMQMRAAGLV